VLDAILLDVVGWLWNTLLVVAGFVLDETVLDGMLLDATLLDVVGWL